MPSPHEIVTALKDYGCTVREDPGWEKRGTRYPFTPYGQAVHHDAATENVSDKVMLNMMREGRVDLSGPLCNGWIDSDSTVWLIAAGNANHAGRNEADVHQRLKAGQPPLGDARLDPDKDTVVGNQFLWGWECRNAGDGRDPWDQLAAMERSCAAVADVYGWSPFAIAGHKELTSRKIDPAGINMDLFRRDVYQYVNPSEDDMKATYIRQKSSTQVYLAGISVPPRPVTLFKDVEYHANREALTILAPPSDAAQDIADADGTVRKVMVVANGDLFGI